MNTCNTIHAADISNTAIIWGWLLKLHQPGGWSLRKKKYTGIKKLLENLYVTNHSSGFSLSIRRWLFHSFAVHLSVKTQHKSSVSMCACQPPAAHTVKFRNERLRKCVCGRVTPVRGVKMYVWICPFRNVYTATPERRKVWLMDLKPLMCQDGCCSTSCPEIIIFLVCDGKKKKYIYIKLTSVLPLTLLSLSASKFNSILIIGGWPVIFKYSPVIISKASIQSFICFIIIWSCFVYSNASHWLLMPVTSDVSDCQFAVLTRV